MKKLNALINEARKQHAIAMDESNSEEVQDAAYTLYWNAAERIADELQEITGIDRITAMRMAHHKLEEIAALTERAN